MMVGGLPEAWDRKITREVVVDGKTLTLARLHELFRELWADAAGGKDEMFAVLQELTLNPSAVTMMQNDPEALTILRAAQRAITTALKFDPEIQNRVAHDWRRT